MPKIPLYEDEARLSAFVDGLIAEMKGQSWTYSDEHYNVAKVHFIDEQTDSDYEVPPSKGMLAVLFHTNLLYAWEMQAQEVWEQDSQFMILHGDIRGYFTMTAPQNSGGFKTVLCDPTNNVVAALTDEGAKAFHRHNTYLNDKLSTRP